jgi:hypothetical protein
MGSRSVALNYVAAAGCPDIEGYSTHVRARSSALSFQPFDAPAPDSVDVRVEAEPEGSGWVGRVVIAGTPTLEREVRGERCEDVVAALALITVLRLEPNGESSVASARAESRSGGEASASSPPAATPSSRSGDPSQRSAADAGNPNTASSTEPSLAPSVSLPTRPATPATPEPPETPGQAPVVPVPETAPREPADASNEAASERESDAAGEAARAGRSPPDAESPEPIARAPDVEVDPAARSLGENEPAADSDEGIAESEPERGREPGQGPVVRAGVAAEVGYATVPDSAPFGLIEGELRFGEGMSSWAAALAFAYARSTSEVRAELGATPVTAELGITLLTAELALCPPAIDATSVWFRACAGVRGGGVHVLITPDDASLSTGDRWRPWLALAPALQVGVPLSERWVIRGVFEVAMQLVRDRFGVLRTNGIEREPVTLYRPLAVSYEFSLGLGYTF